MLFFNPSNLIEWHFQLSQLNGIHALVSFRGGFCVMFDAVAALRGAYTDAHLFETICQGFVETNWMVLAPMN
jgi:hypothetical protein